MAATMSPSPCPAGPRALLLIACLAALPMRLPAQSAPPATAPPPPATAPLRCPAPSAVRDALLAEDPSAARRPTPPSSDTAAVTTTGAPDSDPVVEMSSDSATLGVDGDAVLAGDVRVTQGDRTLSAEDVKYDSRTGVFEVKGEVRYADPALRLSGRGGDFDPKGGAAFDDAAFELPERPARGAAERLTLSSDGKLGLEGVWFSTCPATEPDWRIRARSIDIDPVTRNGTARDAAVEFMGVPILYSPWLSFPVGSQRKSGFLFPNVGYGSRSGLQLEVPYYLDLAPNYDLTLEPVLYGRRGMEVGGRFRYLTRAHRGELQARVLPQDSLKGAERHWLRVAHRGGFGTGWRVELDAQDVSDAEYFEDFGSGVSDASTTFLQRLARASWADEHWLLRGELRDFQVIDRALADDDRPYATLPRLELRGDLARGGERGLRLGVDAELARFDREVGVTGWRFDAAPRVEFEFDRAGWYAKPGASWRYTRYDLSDATGPSKPSRSLPSAWMDAGLRLERATAAGGAARVTLEPRLLYLWTPYRDQDSLPVFDTAVPDLDYVQLFRTTRYVGADRVADADQLSLGVTGRVYDAAGRQLLWATVGQTRYFAQPRVRLPWEPAERRRESDLVAQLGVSAWQDWTVDLGLQWNTRDERRERSDVRLRWRPDAERALNLGWNFQRDGVDQAEFSGAWPIGRRWGVFGKMVYDLEGGDGLERFAGLEYKACCWRLRAVARRFVSDRTGAQDTQLYLQLELNGLSSVGSGADAFLEEAIRGYSRVGASR